jgi:hypothetical protein
MRGSTKLVQRMDENSSNWTPSFGFLSALFQRNRPWGEAGHLLLCLGLIGNDADAKGLAVDALIEGIDNRTFDPGIFAQTMSRVAAGEWVKYNRLGEALMQALPVSDLHAQVISDALENWLPSVDFGQKNVFHVLECLIESQALAKQPLAPTTKAALEKIEGSGKAAKLAKRLLAS